MPNETIITQLIGIAATIVLSVGFFNKNDVILKYLMSLAALLFSVHYFLLDSWTSGVIKLITSARNALSVKFSSEKIMLLFLILYWLLGFFFAEKIVDYAAVITTTISTYALFNFSGIKLRLLFLPATITWLIIAIQTNSIGGLMAESMVLISNLTTITRMYFKNKQSTKA